MFCHICGNENCSEINISFEYNNYCCRKNVNVCDKCKDISLRVIHNFILDIENDIINRKFVNGEQL